MYLDKNDWSLGYARPLDQTPGGPSPGSPPGSPMQIDTPPGSPMQIDTPPGSPMNIDTPPGAN